MSHLSHTFSFPFPLSENRGKHIENAHMQFLFKIHFSPWMSWAWMIIIERIGYLERRRTCRVSLSIYIWIHVAIVIYISFFFIFRMMMTCDCEDWDDYQRRERGLEMGWYHHLSIFIFVLRTFTVFLIAVCVCSDKFHNKPYYCDV